MPTRSIKLKLVVPRAKEQADTRQALWVTHRMVNEAVAYYERHLLLMRGEEYVTAEGVVSREAVSTELLRTARAAQERNGHPGEESDQKILGLLRGLYEQIVPSAVGKKGNAQAANAFLGRLTDPKSKGYLSIFDKVGAIPNWVEGVRAEASEALAAASIWLDSEEGQRRLRGTGSPPKWVRLARSRDPGWSHAFVADLDKKLHEIPGAPTIIKTLKDIGVLPLFDPYLAPRLISPQGVVSPWDRLAFRLAVGHLLSWESWCRLAAEEHAERKARIDRFKDEHITGSLKDRVPALRKYEVERKAELDRIAIALGEPRFRITQRMVRGWTELREKWLKAKDKTVEHLLSIITAEQTHKRGRFGDPHLFRWLARTENHLIWDDPDQDTVSIIARLNAMEALLERSRETATMTLPHPRRHPRSVQWEAEGGTNLKTYKLARTATGAIQAQFPVLKPTDTGKLIEVLLTLWIAPSDQFRDAEFFTEGKLPKVRFKSAADERVQGELGSADLLMDWGYLKHRSEAVIEAGGIGPVYLKLAVDPEPMLPPGWDGRRPPALIHFRTSRSEKSKYQETVTPGLRVLSVDLGIRSFAACSVFELKDRKPSSGLFFELDDVGLWAVHERSFTLDLPGEKVGSGGERWQHEADQELSRLRRTLNRYRKLYGAASLPEEERSSYLQPLLDNLSETDCWPFEERILRDLASQTSTAQPIWDDRVKGALRSFRFEFGQIVSEWRHRTRPRTDSRTKFSGKSMWAVGHLLRVRQFLQSWSLLGRGSGDIRRLNREKAGVFAVHLLDHLDGIKEDRLKTGADLIVQAARGYLRDTRGNWYRAYEPCHAVLFEDLSRYRTRTDRPRRENSQLMKWAHRAVPREVAMQGQLYGIHCEETSAAFSSRYHAASGAPGIRCHSLKVADFADPAFREVVERENPGINLDQYAAGDLVPLSGGEIFVCLNGKGLTRIHADIDAAQNLQRRFWTRHAHAFRVVAVKVTIDGKEAWVPQRLGKRLLGGLGGYGYLVPTGHESGSCRWQSLSRAKWRHLAGASVATERDEEASFAETEELVALEEEALEYSSIVTVFFRDPSGVVLPADLWYPSPIFWSVVKMKTAARLKLTG